MSILVVRNYSVPKKRVYTKFSVFISRTERNRVEFGEIGVTKPIPVQVCTGRFVGPVVLEMN